MRSCAMPVGLREFGSKIGSKLCGASAGGIGMLEDNQFALSHARNGVNEAKRLFGDQKLRVDRLMAAGEDAREAQQTLGLLEVYLSILERHSEYLSREKKLR
jgi:hypothetical protein